MFTNVKYEENEDDKTIFEYSVCSDKFVCMHGENNGRNYAELPYKTKLLDLKDDFNKWRYNYTFMNERSLYCKNVGLPQINVYIYCHSKSSREWGAEWNYLKFVRIVRKKILKEKWGICPTRC